MRCDQPHHSVGDGGGGGNAGRARGTEYRKAKRRRGQSSRYSPSGSCAVLVSLGPVDLGFSLSSCEKWVVNRVLQLQPTIRDFVNVYF